MKVRVIDAGNHDAARKIDAARVGIGHRRDVIRGPNRHDSIASDRHSLGISAGWVGGEELAAYSNRTRSGLGG